MGVLLGAALQMGWAQDVAQGKIQFQACESCHQVEEGALALGPSLHGVVGRNAAAVPGYRYSPALKKSQIVWTPESLDRFLADPQAMVPGNRMPYSGLPDPVDRANLIAYLNSLP